MKDQRPFELWARKLERIDLNPAEEAELATALIESAEFADQVSSDRDLHELLQIHFQLASRSESFLVRCQQLAGEPFSSGSKSKGIGEEASPAGRSAASAIAGDSPQVDIHSGGKVARARRIVSRRRLRSVVGPVLAYSLAAIGLLLATGWLLSRMGPNPSPSREVVRHGQAPAALATKGQPAQPARSQRPQIAHSEAPLKQGGTELSSAEGAENRGENSAAPGGDPSALAVDRGLDVVAEPSAIQQGRMASRGDPTLLRISEDASWRVAPSDPFEFPQRFDLQTGLAEIETPNGATLWIRGPASVCLGEADSIEIESGEVQIDIPADQQSVTVQAPHVRFSAAPATRVYLTAETGQPTQLHLAHGEVWAHPWNGNAALQLTSTGLNRSSIGPAWTAEVPEPATAIAADDQGRMEGIVNIADRPLSIRSPEVLAQVLETTRQELQQKPKGFPEEWRKLVDQVDAASAGQISVNGQTESLQSPADVLETFRQLQRQAENPLGKGAANFSGVLNVNGREQRFDSPQEFFQAQEQLFGAVFSKMLRSPALGMPRDSSGTRTDNSSSNIPMKGNSASAFSGMININGQGQTFSRQEDFERAMQKFRRR